MHILKFPNPDLFKPCKEVTVFGPELKVMLESMWETMIAERGLGLAANQVGLPYRMFTMIHKEEKLFIVNPRVLEYSKHPSDIAEGCLSAPGELVKLYRPDWVKLSFQDENGTLQTRIFMDIHSVCVQHEIEHLDGKSYLQNKAIPKRIRTMLAKKWGFKVK